MVVVGVSGVIVVVGGGVADCSDDVGGGCDVSNVNVESIDSTRIGVVVDVNDVNNVVDLISASSF